MDTLLFISKKGDLSVIKYFIGITLNHIIAKLNNIVLLMRIKPAIDQGGFRTNRSRAEQILTIHRILEGVKDKIYHLLSSTLSLLRLTRR